MKQIIVNILFAILFAACVDKLEKEKYDQTFLIRNKTSDSINLKIELIRSDINPSNDTQLLKQANLISNDQLEYKFNVKRDFGLSEGGFNIKAYKPNGDSLVLNSGYFTNYQVQGKNPLIFEIRNDQIVEEK